jgi:hypothetical protein
MIAPVLRSVTATRYATPLREGGSLPGLIEADDDGLYVVKFRAAGQGVKSLVAEIIVGELGRALGLPVPEIVLVDVPEALGRTEPDPEINELVTRSTGINVGLDFLPAALDYNAARPETIEADLASRIVWFDAYGTNVDRTPRNPNMLIWHGRPWLIDHGAALYQHHGATDLPSRAHDRFAPIREHVLLPGADDLAAADAELSQKLTPQLIADTVGLVPDTLLGGSSSDDGREDGQAAVPIAALRAQYIDYLTARAAAPREFYDEIVSARER